MVSPVGEGAGDVIPGGGGCGRWYPRWGKVREMVSPVVEGPGDGIPGGGRCGISQKINV